MRHVDRFVNQMTSSGVTSAIEESQRSVGGNIRHHVSRCVICA
jgi:hypothetical protein